MVLLRAYEPGPWPAAHCRPPEAIVDLLMAMEPGQEARFMQVDLAAAFSDRADDWPNALLDALPGADEGAWAVTVDLSGWGVTVTRRSRRPGIRLRRDIYRPPRDLPARLADAP